MPVILLLIVIIVLIVAIVKSSRSLKSLQELRQQIDDWNKRQANLTARTYRLEKQLGEEGVQAAAEEETPAIAAIPPVEERPPEVPPVSPEEAVRPPTGEFAPSQPEQTATSTAAPPGRPADGKDAWAKFEEIVGKRWMTWVGVLVLFFSAGFFLKYAFDHDVLGPRAQIIIAIAGGIALLGGGHWSIRKEMGALGQGLIGGGLMILYAALFAAYSPAVYGESVMPQQELAFALMCLVTAAGVILAIKHNAIAISFLAVLGGFLTPVLVSTGTNARDTLFAYILLLDLGVIAVALYRRWRAVDVLAFAGTSILFSAWFHEFYEAAAMVPTLLWLGTFYLVFLIIPFINHLRQRTAVTVERFIMALANATFAFGFAYSILHNSHDGVLAWIALGMAAAYLALGILTRKRIAKDGRALFGFIALAVLFLIISVPLQFGMNGITLVWMGEASVLLYLGYRFRYHPVRVGGFIVLLLAIGRVLVVHWEQAEHFGAFTPILNRKFLILMCAPIGAAIFAVIHQVWQHQARADDRTLKLLSTIGAGLLALLFLHFELEQWLTYRAIAMGIDSGYLKGCVLTVLWALGATGFLSGGLGGRSTVIRCAGVIPLLVTGVLAMVLYTESVSHHYWVFLNGRFGSALFVCALLFAYAFAVRDRAARTASLVGAGYATLTLIHVELYQWIWKVAPEQGINADYLCAWVLAILWALGAAAYLAAGVWKESRGFRLGGILPLVMAATLSEIMYFMNPPHGYWMFLNARFLAGAATCGMLLAYTLVSGRIAKHLDAHERPIATIFLWCTIIGFLVLFSMEPYLWYTRTISDAMRARWLAQMSVTIVWGLYASALLTIGFWRRVRSVRLAALGLFGLAAVKLAVVDLEEIEQIYRIISFFVLGILMIGASYLYHRAEVRLKEASGKNQDKYAKTNDSPSE